MTSYVFCLFLICKHPDSQKVLWHQNNENYTISIPQKFSITFGIRIFWQLGPSLLNKQKWRAMIFFNFQHSWNCGFYFKGVSGCVLQISLETRIHSSRMRTVRSLPSPNEALPGQRPSRTEALPLDRDRPWTETPGQRPSPPPPCGQTNTCENIAFANFVRGR